jgi:hypothetical protein
MQSIASAGRPQSGGGSKPAGQIGFVVLCGLHGDVAMVADCNGIAIAGGQAFAAVTVVASAVQSIR